MLVAGSLGGPPSHGRHGHIGPPGGRGDGCDGHGGDGCSGEIGRERERVAKHFNGVLYFGTVGNQGIDKHA